ncbi:ParB-like nuclease domain containing protein [Methanonatronarchaeum thermophilum]|uniref:ParB-like nuclease domain containing protein n=1 Tax=Methanonatronarchaeum thermophilum TaxID=1927129 RepID=A0A1Y3GIM5_9EURY|nr:hypothetical protein [Methanonatronarchaeum thermophilum]OUJ19285.1 ParB-like nuclease domain containing protein [Methanonatronarchaeum thermophilum]
MINKELQKSRYKSFKNIWKEKGFWNATKEVYTQLKPYLNLNKKYKLKNIFRYYYNRFRFRKSRESPYKLFYIDPSEIEYKTKYKKNPFNKNEYYRIKESLQYKSFYKHFIEGVPWEDTGFYQKKIKKAEQGIVNPNNRYGTVKKINKRFKEIDKLADKFKKDGYKTQREIDEELENCKEIPLLEKAPIPEKNEVIVNVDEDGTLIRYGNGRHRFRLAKILNIKSIPVRVRFRHKKWHKIREEIAKANKISELSEKAKKHQNHPDLQDLIKNLED